MEIESYRDLKVWQRGMSLALEIYKITRRFPKEEKFGLVSQMRRAAISIPSNIAEGKYRSTRKDFTQFLKIAYSSGAELETQVLLAKQLENMKDLNYNEVDKLLSETMKMLNVLIRKLESKS